MADPRFYRYIHRDDDGRAPCTDNGLVSLATCKPSIRATASIGDFVAGYMPKALGEGLITWIGRIERVMSPTEYEQQFRGRKDAQYRLMPTGKIQRVYPDYHPDADQQRKDLSAKILLFDPTATWYFGHRPVQPPLPLDFLKAAGQGHRVNLRRPGDVAELLEWLMSVGEAGLHGGPRSNPSGDCGSGCGPFSRRSRELADAPH